MALKKDFLETHKSVGNDNDIIRYDEDINYLINAGVSLNTQTTTNNETLLHIAVWKGQVRSVERLISLGAKMDIQDISGNTPLHLAVIKQDIAMIKLLIQTNGIDIKTLEVKNQNGNTALNIAQKKANKEIVFMISLLSFNLENINDINKEIYKEFINKLGELEKLEVPIFVRNSLNEEFKKDINSLKKIEGELTALKIEHDRLQNAKNSKKWWNVITLGFYKKKIIKKLMENRTNNSKKCLQLFAERDKMKNNIEEINKMIANEKKILEENEKLKLQQLTLQQELQVRTEELQVKKEELVDFHKICETLKAAQVRNDKRIAELNDSVEKLTNRVAELQTENDAFSKTQKQHNEQAPVLFITMKNQIRGLTEDKACLQAELDRLTQQQSNDSGISSDETCSKFDAEIVNKSDLSMQNRERKHSLTNN